MARLEIKSKYGIEFRRISISPDAIKTYKEFYDFIEHLHHLQSAPFVIQYADPRECILLPINNDENFHRALKFSTSILRLLLQPKGASYGEFNGYKAPPNSRLHLMSRLTAADVVRSSEKAKLPSTAIILKDDFRCVSSIIDVDIVPETMRRVRLRCSGSKPLGFHIRESYSSRVTSEGVMRAPGVFISRLDTKGLAASTGLLAVKDEVIEVNGIEVRGKSLDQVVDMMVANSSNLIITVKPVNQNTCVHVPRQNPTSVGNSTTLAQPPAPPMDYLRDPENKPVNGKHPDRHSRQTPHSGGIPTPTPKYDDRYLEDDSMAGVIDL